MQRDRGHVTESKLFNYWFIIIIFFQLVSPTSQYKDFEMKDVNHTNVKCIQMFFLSNSIYPSLKVNNSMSLHSDRRKPVQSHCRIWADFQLTLASPAFVLWWGVMVVDVICLAVLQCRCPPLCRSVDFSCPTCRL